MGDSTRNFRHGWNLHTKVKQFFRTVLRDTYGGVCVTRGICTQRGIHVQIYVNTTSELFRFNCIYSITYDELNISIPQKQSKSFHHTRLECDVLFCLEANKAKFIKSWIQNERFRSALAIQTPHSKWMRLVTRCTRFHFLSV